MVDTSVILAVLFDEPDAAWAADQLAEHAAELSMSTVNLAESLIRIRDRQPRLYPELEADLLGSGMRFVAPDVEQAQIAAEARLTYPLNLGDCFAYALAVVRKRPLLTMDSDFLRIDVKVVHPSLSS